MSISSRMIPGWIHQYSRTKLGADLAAGLIVAILVIPQSLAYALLAGLPPQAGLYVSIFPVIAYALLGSSMVQAVDDTESNKTAYAAPVRPNTLFWLQFFRSCPVSCCWLAVYCASGFCRSY